MPDADQGAVRIVLRCPHCNLNQFEPLSGKCRRCKGLMREQEQVEVEAESKPKPKPKPVSPTPFLPLPSFWLPILLTGLRQRAGITQQELANRLGTPRNYVSKVENAVCLPRMDRAAIYADALGVPFARVMQMCDWLIDSAKTESAADSPCNPIDNQANVTGVLNVS